MIGHHYWVEKVARSDKQVTYSAFLWHCFSTKPVKETGGWNLSVGFTNAYKHIAIFIQVFFFVSVETLPVCK